ncbi:HAMP domain-containing histidine kinase, partial [Candidatus Uhrbacteria bacterium]|nr:HAMP domain-containing histidine kinase [Candidatus Uhrbacteria bacterium]
SKKQEEFVEEAYGAVGSMTKLIDDLLKVSSVESGRYKFLPSKVDMKGVFEHALETLNYLAKARNVKIFNEIPSILPEVNTDREGMIQVVSSLLDNAIKYSPKGKVEIFCFPDSRQLLFSIKDNGIGIPKEKQDKIFEKFFRAENAEAMYTSGSGLSLYIAKNIIEVCGGKIWFESTLGKGTTFYFSLPLTK